MPTMWWLGEGWLTQHITSVCLQSLHFRWIVLQTMSGSLWGRWTVKLYRFHRTQKIIFCFSFHVVTFNIIIFLLFMAHARAVFTDPGIVPLPHHRWWSTMNILNMNNKLVNWSFVFLRIDFSDSHSDGGSIAPKEDWTICTRWGWVTDFKFHSHSSVLTEKGLIEFINFYFLNFKCDQVWDVQTTSGPSLQNLQTLH